MKSIFNPVFFLAFSIGLFINKNLYAGAANPFLEKGWSELVRDNDVEALNYFNLAYEKAARENDTEDIAESLLDMGICYYMVSYSTGLEYCSRAMAEYKKLEQTAPQKAFQGRCKCLQLISTIYSRQGKYKEAIALSKEALTGFSLENDSGGYRGLIYSSLGVAYQHLAMKDSSEYYYRLALEEHLRTRNFIYLPSAYLNMAEVESDHGNRLQSRILYDRAMALADSTGNRQAQVSSLLGKGKWFLMFGKDEKSAEACFLNARKIASLLSDKSFYLRSLGTLFDLKKKHGDYQQALVYEDEMRVIRDTLYSWDKQKAVKSLEIQFEVSEKDRKLELAKKEKDIALLTNYLLWGAIGFLVSLFVVIVLFLKRINKRDKLLLQTKEDLVKAVEEQKRLKEQKMQNDLEFKENQLSAMTLQMLQKNELMQELKDQLETNKDISADTALSKIINKGLNHDKEWSDFNASFESMNKNFYVKLKQAYPEISPNDLKICALIKLNLSIKEMAGILNISPDSVKTARYRLRKKLQLNTEDNLTDFILKLE